MAPGSFSTQRKECANRRRPAITRRIPSRSAAPDEQLSCMLQTSLEASVAPPVQLRASVAMLDSTAPTGAVVTHPLRTTVERTDSELPVGFTFGRYTATALLARGGMGAVYLGVERATGRKVALKVLEPRFASHDELVQ